MGSSTLSVPERSLGTHDFAPVYYPSAFTIEEATPIVIRASEEHGAVDITLTMMSTSVVAGRIRTPDGRPLGSVHLSLTRAAGQSNPITITTSMLPDGSFRFSSVAPGRYLLAARAMSPDLVRSSFGLRRLETPR
jgi:hypothetical protein